MRPTFDKFKEKALKRKEVKKVYDELAPVYKLRKKLLALRLKSGMTQEQLAEKMNTKKSNISRLECGEKPSFPTWATINKYAKALGYEVEINFNPIDRN